MTLFEQYMMTRVEKSNLNGVDEVKATISISKNPKVGPDALELLWQQIQGLKGENWECRLLPKLNRLNDVKLQEVRFILIKASA